MSGSNPNIIMGYRPTPLGPDFGKTIANAQSLLQVKQQQEATQRQNALLGIFKDPASLDQTGNPTPETLQKVMSVDPNAGMAMRQNMLVGQEHKLRTEAMGSELMAKKMDMIGETTAPILETYETEIKSGVPEEQARRNGQASLMQANERLKASGVFSEADYSKFPTQFDPMQMRNVVAGTKQYQDWLKQQRDDQKEARQAKHQEDQDKAGQWHAGLGPNAKGEQVGGMWFTPKDGGEPTFHPGVTVAPTGAGSAAVQDRDALKSTVQDAYTKKYCHPANLADPQEAAAFNQMLLDAEAEQKRKLAGAATQGRIEAGGGSTGSQDRKAVENVVRAELEFKLGRPLNLDDPKDRAEFDRQVLAKEDERKATQAGAAAGARADATAKPKDVLEDGKPTQVLWKGGKQVHLDGTPVTGEIRSAKPATPAAAAEADAMTVADARIKAAEEKNGGPLTDEQKAEIRRSARSDPKVQEAIRKSEGTAIDDDAAKIIAEETIRGDFHGTVGMGRNQASMRKIANFRGQIAKELGLSGADLAANTAEFMGVVAAERVLGTRGAGIDLGISEAKKFAPMVLAASDAIDRTKYPTINAMQLAIEKGTGGENVIRLIDALNAYKMAYTQILTRGGMPTDDARKRSDEIIDKQWSAGQIRTAIDQLSKEMDAAQSAVPAVRDNLYKALTGKTRNTEPPPKNQTPGQQGSNQPVQTPQASDVAYLKANPAKAAAFDLRFGNGAAQRILQPAQGAPTIAPGVTIPGGTVRPNGVIDAPPATGAKPTEAQGVPAPEQYANLPDGKTFTSKSTGQKFVKRDGKIYPVEGGNDAALKQAREAIRLGAPRDAVIKRLQDAGIDTKGL